MMLCAEVSSVDGSTWCVFDKEHTLELYIDPSSTPRVIQGYPASK